LSLFNYFRLYVYCVYIARCDGRTGDFHFESSFDLILYDNSMCVFVLHR
jgi:hypothetical protein